MAAVRRIVVGVHGSLGSLQALRYAADESREREVPLVPVIAWIPPGGDFAERSHPSPYLRKVWREAAWQRLLAAFETGLGGTPADLRIEARARLVLLPQRLRDLPRQRPSLCVLGCHYEWR